MIEEEAISKALSSVGLYNTESKIYLDLVKNHESTVNLISKRIKMHRSNVYDILEKLKEKNMVYSTERNGTKVFTTLSPDLILQEQKEKLENLKSVVDYLQKVYKSKNEIHKVYILEGIDALKSILLNMLDFHESIWMYGLADKEGIANLLNDRVMNAFHSERIKRQIHIRYLFYSYPVEKMKDLNKLKFSEARFLSRAHQDNSRNISQIVCGKMIYFTIWLDPIYIIAIESDIIAQEYTNFYNILWEYCTEV